MALSLQRKLELAGELSKVQPLLQRLHLLEKPKRRHRVRNVILVSSAIGAGAVFLVAVSRRRARPNSAVTGDGGLAQTGSPTQDTSDTEVLMDYAAQPG